MNIDLATARALEWLERHAGEQSGGGWISREDAQRLVALVELLAMGERPKPVTRWSDVWRQMAARAFAGPPPAVHWRDDPRKDDARYSRPRELRPAMQSDMDHVMPPPPVDDLNDRVLKGLANLRACLKIGTHDMSCLEASVDHTSHRTYAPDERRPPATGGLYGEPRGDDLS